MALGRRIHLNQGVWDQPGHNTVRLPFKQQLLLLLLLLTTTWTELGMWLGWPSA